MARPRRIAKNRNQLRPGNRDPDYFAGLEAFETLRRAAASGPVTASIPVSTGIWIVTRKKSSSESQLGFWG